MFPTQSVSVNVRSGLFFYCRSHGITHTLVTVAVSRASNNGNVLVFIKIVQLWEKFLFCSLKSARNANGVSPDTSFNFSEDITSFSPISSDIDILAFTSDCSYVVAFPESPLRPTSKSLFKLVMKSPPTAVRSFLICDLQLSPSFPRKK